MADTRSRAELDAILGASYSGVQSSDDYSAYNGYPVKAQQKCLAHLHCNCWRGNIEPFNPCSTIFGMPPASLAIQLGCTHSGSSS